MKSVHTELVEIMQRTGLVPLFSHTDPETAARMVEAAYRGGVRILEFTNRNPNSPEVFQYLVQHRSRYPELKLGIGTVLDGATTKTFIDAGADFIVSPILIADMAKICRDQSIAWIPGCATLTEIVNARDLGATVIKVFPGSVLGPGFISSILPVVPDLKLMITGGVEMTEESFHAWFKAGSLCVGLGSNLFKKEILEARDWDQLEAKVAQALAMIRKVRTELNLI